MTVVGAETCDIERIDTSFDVHTEMIDLTSVESIDFNESGSVVHFVRHRRLGMRERNVMTTEIISSENSIVGRSGWGSGIIFVERLLDVAVKIRNIKFLVKRLIENNMVVHSPHASTIRANMEEFHDIGVNDRVLRLNNRFVMTTMIVVSEEYFFFSLHVLGELRVDKEDG